MDVTRDETVGKDLDAMIERRASRTPDPDELEPSYAESVRRHNEKIRRANRAAWIDWHLDQAERHRRTLEDLAARHEARAAALLESGEGSSCRA